MKNDQQLISIIVPIYNVKPYLRRCVDSILNQTYKNLEIFLVDDGATDGCGLICDEYAAKDERIKVIHKENGGLSDARNVAIDVATGDFILCVDSDDYVHHTLVETLHDSLKEFGADISVIGRKDVYDGDEIDLVTRHSNETTVFGVEDGLEAMLYQQDMTTSAWGKLYKAELFADGIRYPKGKLCEDLDTTYKLFAKSSKIVSNSAQLYYYLQRDDSIIKSAFKLGRADALKFAEDQLFFIRKKFPNIEKAACNRLFMEAVFIMLTMSKEDRANYHGVWNECADTLKTCRRIVLLDTKSPKMYRIYALFSIISPRMIYGIDSMKKRIKTIRRCMA